MLEVNNPDKPETDKVNSTEHSEIDNDESSDNIDTEVIAEGTLDEGVIIPDE